MLPDSVASKSRVTNYWLRLNNFWCNIDDTIDTFELEKAWGGVPERIGALMMFSELKKSLVVSEFKPLPPV